MNKKTFLKKLKDRLSILDEKEVNDIISEYSDIMDEKVKNGVTVTDAINDFGDIDTLSAEILKAYKINSKYHEKKDIVNDFENIIKDTATKTSDFIKKIVGDIKENNITFEFICEILIKVLILIFICSLLRLPFALIVKLGESILDIIFFPLSSILTFIYSFVVWILYFLCCIFIGIHLFKNNIKSDAKDVKKTKEKVKKNKEIKEEVVEEKTVKVKKENNFGKIILDIVKAFLYICFIVPLLFVNVGLVVITVGVIYYLIIGINLWGILLIIVGLLIFFETLTYTLYNLFNKKKKFIFPFLISVVLITVGCFITFDTFRHFEYLDYNRNIKTKELNYEIDKITYIDLDAPYDIIADETKDNLTIEIIYDEKFIEIYNYEHKNNIDLDIHYKNNNFYDIYDEIIENLKNNKIVNYANVNEVKYKIYAPKEIINKIIVR